MAEKKHFLIIDGYPEAGRDELEGAGMKLAWKLYVDMLQHYLPEASYELSLPGDPGTRMPIDRIPEFDGILWTGCSLSLVTQKDEPRVVDQVEFAKEAFRIGVPSFGSCWALQIATVAAGGRVTVNPKGREMGMARKIHLTDQGKEHPFFAGRSSVFEAFISHDDEVTRLPQGGVNLASNEWTEVQAIAVTHRKGTFWATQYHPEYDLHEIARLVVAREPKLVKFGFFKGHEDLMAYVEDLEALAKEPDRKDLRWKLAIDDDVLDQRKRQNEFVNWLEKQVG